MSNGKLNLAQFSTLFIENNKDAVVVLDPHGVILSWNESAENLYGYSSEEILNQPISVLFPAELPGEHLVRRGNLRSKRPVLDWHVQQISKDGSEISTTISVSPLFDHAEKLMGRCVIARESRPPDSFQNQGRHMQKLEAVGRLAGGIAHDFNNLLTVISGYNGMLRSALPEESPLLAYAFEVEKAADRAAALTGQLLIFSRRAVTTPQVMNLNLVAQDLERMLGRIIGAKIKIVLDLSPDLENIKADPGQISQMLMNLASNARDAMPGGGVLQIKTSNIKIDPLVDQVVAGQQAWAPGEYVQIDVSDTGSGMDEHTQQHLFEPYFTTKVLGKGTGLGLSIVYGIVSRMRGHIHVVSKLGEGATFTVSFPATSEPCVPAAQISDLDSASEVPVTGKHILLVEDEEGVRMLVKEMLLKLGYRVDEACTAEKAMELNAATMYDLVLTDVILPTMQGGELAMTLQETRPTLKVLYMSGYVDDSVLTDKFLRTGGNFLLKPFSAEQLSSHVRSSLHISPAVRAGSQSKSKSRPSD